MLSSFGDVFRCCLSRDAQTSSTDLSEVISCLLVQDVRAAFSALKSIGVSPPLCTNLDDEVNLSELETALVRSGMPSLDRLKILRAAVGGLAHRPSLQFSMAAGRQDKYVMGVVRVRDFAIISSVLKEKIVTLINQVAEVVHVVVNCYRTADIKILGGTVLIMWQVLETNLASISSTAEIALFTLSKLLAAVNCSSVLASYRRHPGLQQFLGTQSRVNLSCSLHFGWAVKGAVGNELAMEVSYVSSDMRLASRLERASHVYQVPFLVSQALVELCSPSLMAKCRLIDRVIFAGCSEPMDLFSFDLHCESLQVEEDSSKHFACSGEVNRRMQDCFLQTLVEAKSRDGNVADMLDDDLHVSTMRGTYSMEFLQIFRMGLQNYLEGEWDVARRMLRATKGMLGFDDGPSNALVDFMQKFNSEAPPSWNGYREFDNSVAGDGWL